MLILRSIIFNIMFFSTITAAVIFFSFLRFFDRHYTFVFWHYLSILLNFITIKIGGIKFVIENEKNLLKEPAIYAIRHESAWETLILIHKFKNPIFILKEELLKIPFFGTLSKKAETIAVNRKDGAKTLFNAVSKIKSFIAEGHPIIIFPEGTRVAHGKYVPLKRGISLFYKKTNCPVVPVIHDSGYFWPRRGFIKKPGTITLKFSDPIVPGLSQDEFMDKLNTTFDVEIRKLKDLKEKKHVL